MFVLQFLETIRNMLTEFANYQLILLKPFCVSAIRMFIYVQRFLFWSLSVSFIVFLEENICFNWSDFVNFDRR